MKDIITGLEMPPSKSKKTRPTCRWCRSPNIMTMRDGRTVLCRHCNSYDILASDWHALGYDQSDVPLAKKPGTGSGAGADLEEFVI